MLWLIQYLFKSLFLYRSVSGDGLMSLLGQSEQMITIQAPQRPDRVVCLLMRVCVCVRVCVLLYAAPPVDVVRQPSALA